MLNVTKELTALARKLGYTGKAPDTVAKAIDAITASVGSSGSGGGNGPLILTMEEYDPEKHDALIGEEVLTILEEAEAEISSVLVGATSQEVFNAFPNVAYKYIIDGAINLNPSEHMEYSQSENDFYNIQFGGLEFIGSSNSIMVLTDA